MKSLAAALLLLPSLCAGQTVLEVKRGQMQIKVRLHGTTVIVGDSIIRMRAAVEGRVEDLNISTGSWFEGGKVFGHLANKEMAAILDSHNTTEQGVMEDRWKKVYEPTPIACPGDCYVLRVFVKNKEWLKPKTLLVEAATKMLLQGRVRPDDTKFIKDGQEFEFWAVDNPAKKYKGRVANYVLDLQGNKFNPGASFTIDLTPSRYFDPGTEWEGLAVPVTKSGVLVVPTSSIIEYQGGAWIPVRVSTGMTTNELTEITAGLREKQDVLLLDDARLREATRHAFKLDEMKGLNDPKAPKVEDKIKKDYLKPEPLPGPKIKSLPDPDATYGDDPYAQ